MTDTRGWQERWDELELRADPDLMPLILGLRADMELMSETAVEYVRILGLAAKQRQQILDAQALFEEHNV